MDPSAELLQLLREIRDSQRELLTMMKAWDERAEKRYAEYEPKWRESNEIYLRQAEAYARQQQIGKRVGIVCLVFLGIAFLVGIASLILTRLGFIQ